MKLKHWLSRSASFGSKSLYSTMETAASGLARINFDEKTTPMLLFNEWMDEAKSILKTRTVLMNLATASRDGVVSNRTLVLRDLKPNSFVFLTNENSKKIKQIVENPKVAICFHFNYPKDEKYINKQVKIEGIAQKLPQDEARKLYEMEPLFCKIRSHICDQGEKVDWNELKQKHDRLLEEVLVNKRQLEMPENQVAYEVAPNNMDFYYAFDNYIADRILFKKIGNKWEVTRIAT